MIAPAAIDGRLDHLPAGRAGDPGDQPDLTLVFFARFPVRAQLVQERGSCRGRARTGSDRAALRRPVRRSRPRRPARSFPASALAFRPVADTSIKIASRSSRSPPLTTRRLPPSPSSRIGPESASICSARNIDKTARLDREIDQRRHRVRLPRRARDLFAADRPAVVKRQGQRGRVVGIGDREPRPPRRVQRHHAA